MISTRFHWHFPFHKAACKAIAENKRKTLTHFVCFLKKFFVACPLASREELNPMNVTTQALSVTVKTVEIDGKRMRSGFKIL
jgi:hypothetical protein